MKKYNKCSQFPLPCAFPIPEPPEIQSGFRAVRSTTNTPQAITAATITQVQYPNEQYDLRNEYTPLATLPPTIPASTFIPKSNGIYDIIASVLFATTVATPAAAYNLLISITVNNTAVASNSELTAEANNAISVSTNIQLKAGDQVQVFITSAEAGSITSNPAFTHFEATRLPSPTI
ncbi:TPA: hypothetical protein QCX47_004947 [Bacillus mycoides]|nr:hypothetical protein [Bacillus mycoides]